MEPLQVWNEFTQKLRDGLLTQEDCKPINGFCFGFFITRSDQEEFRKSILSSGPPTYEYGEEKLIFKINQGKPSEVRFDFVIENSRWYLYIVDACTIPIKAIDELPFTDFPAFDSWKEAFLRAERIITSKVHVYLAYTKEKGKEAALSELKDGFGFRVNASAWMPYFSPPKAFVVLIAWVESRLNGEKVAIEKFSDTHCIIHFRDHIWFKVYDIATHLRARITRDDYRELFENAWRDRAKQNEWNVKFQYDGYDTRIILTSPSVTEEIAAKDKKP